MDNTSLLPVRCKHCDKLLAKMNGTAEIKCPRCGYLNVIESHEVKNNNNQSYKRAE